MRFTSDTYTIHRKFFMLVGGKYYVYNSEGKLIFFSQKKPWKLKEEIRVYLDESMTQELLLIQARSIVDFSTLYDIIDSHTKEKIGILKRKGWESLVQDSWEYLDANEHLLATLEEDSILFSFLRRFVTSWIPQVYYAKEKKKDETLAIYKQMFHPFFLKFRVTILSPAFKKIDPRLLLAAGILLIGIEPGSI
jgi:hypothetical protein